MAALVWDAGISNCTPDPPKLGPIFSPKKIMDVFRVWNSQLHFFPYLQTSSKNLERLSVHFSFIIKRFGRLDLAFSRLNAIESAVFVKNDDSRFIFWIVNDSDRL